jgi:Protein of unknown function (DUF2997)
MKSILVTFSGGQVVVKTEGFAGAACLAATAKLEADLALEKSSDEKTAEYYQQATQAATLKAGQR